MGIEKRGIRQLFIRGDISRQNVIYYQSFCFTIDSDPAICVHKEIRYMPEFISVDTIYKNQQ